jgi:diguanylate cyclase (GGDEF)-like protein
MLLLFGLVVTNVGVMVILLPGGLGASEVLDAVGNVVLYGAALSLVMTRGRADFGGAIDTAIIGLAVGGLLWNFVLLPIEERYDALVVSEVHAFLVIFALAGVLGALIRLRRVTAAGFSALWLLVIALICAIVGNIALALAGNAWLRTPAVVTFMAAYTCIGLFGLDPTAYRVIPPGGKVRENLSGARLLFLGIAVAIIPVALGISDLIGGQVNGTLLVAGGAVVTVLVMVRIRQLYVDRQRAEQALSHMASHDPLTGLVNRREFMARLGEQLQRTPRTTILFCDLDGFKKVNDRLGHTAGDRLLIEVAQRLVASVRQSDMVARLGGDEFLISLKDAQPVDVDGVLQHLSSALSEPIAIQDESVTVGTSIGAVTASETAEPEELIKSADQAMYRAKQQEPKMSVRIVTG